MKEAYLLNKKKLKIMGENGYNFSRKNNLTKIVNINSLHH